MSLNPGEQRLFKLKLPEFQANMPRLGEKSTFKNYIYSEVEKIFFFSKNSCNRGVVVHDFWEAEAGGSPWYPGHPGLHRELQDSWSYRGTLSQRKQNKASHICFPSSFLFTWPYSKEYLDHISPEVVHLSNNILFKWIFSGLVWKTAD